MGKEKKQAYITIGLPTETLTILKRFMEVEGLTTKEIFAEIADAYMVARDEELYNQLRAEYLGVERIRDILAKKESNEPEKALLIKPVDYTMANGQTMNGREVMEAQIRNAVENGGYTWYSTSALRVGMNEKSLKKYLDLIRTGTVYAYFVVNDKESKNEIAYRAKIEDIVTSREKIPAPCAENDTRLSVEVNCSGFGLNCRNLSLIPNEAPMILSLKAKEQIHENPWQKGNAPSVIPFISVKNKKEIAAKKNRGGLRTAFFIFIKKYSRLQNAVGNKK